MESKARLFSWLLALALFLLPATAATWSGKVVGVTDGDTITVLRAGRGEQIRLYGIDCPEKRQAFGARAKQATSGLVFAKIVEVESVTMDRYGRTVALVPAGDTLVNEEPVWEGLARVFTRYCNRPVCQGWKTLGAEAREARRGLWSMPKPVPPGEYRGQEEQVRLWQRKPPTARASKYGSRQGGCLFFLTEKPYPFRR